jgi:hypothetical protein
MAELLTIALLCALAIFIVWESLRSRKVSREEMEKGFRPGWKAAQTGLLVAAGAMVWFGFEEWIQPTQPPFEGYGTIIRSVLYVAVGPRGVPIAAWVVAVTIVVTVIAQWRKK